MRIAHNQSYRNQSVVMPLVAINIVAFILQMIFYPTFTEMFVVKNGDFINAPWTIVTSMFLHGSFIHIFINMYVLLMFGSLLEQRIGPNKFLVVYFTSGILAGIVSSFVYPSALGASGAIMGVFGVIMMIMPNLRVLLFLFIPMPLWIAGILFAIYDIVGAVNPGGNTANVAHLVGMAVGLLYGLKLRKQKRIFKRKFHSKTHLSEEDVDEYLKTGRI